MAMMICNECKDEGKDTQIPYDEIGVELMKAHLKEHDEQTKTSANDRIL